MSLVLNFVFRAILLCVGLVFAAVMACFFVLMLAIWLLGAAWNTVTGRPVNPFVVRMGPRGAFDEMMRRAQRQQEPASRTPRADEASGVRRSISNDVTDVDPK